MFELMDLPYGQDAFEPYLSARTLDHHHKGHHGTYVRNLNQLVAERCEYQGLKLKEVICLSHEKKDTKIFNNSAQIWNHDFYWNSLSPIPQDRVISNASFQQALEASFGSMQAFKDAFAAAALGQFGSGWGWLVLKDDGKLDIMCTANAEVPFLKGDYPLLTIDVWEHAYYLDYQQKRADYLKNIIEFGLNMVWAEKRFAMKFAGQDF